LIIYLLIHKNNDYQIKAEKASKASKASKAKEKETSPQSKEFAHTRREKKFSALLDKEVRSRHTSVAPVSEMDPRAPKAILS